MNEAHLLIGARSNNSDFTSEVPAATIFAVTQKLMQAFDIAELTVREQDEGVKLEYANQQGWPYRRLAVKKSGTAPVTIQSAGRLIPLVSDGQPRICSCNVAALYNTAMDEIIAGKTRRQPVQKMARNLDSPSHFN